LYEFIQQKIITMKRTFFLIISVLCLFAGNKAMAQVTIGSLDDPQSFSVLELTGGGTRGFRFPQMTTIQRDAMVATSAFDAEKGGKARGLQIFNTTTECIETWNGTKWIQQCPPGGPAPSPVSPSSVSYSCGIGVDETECIFTALDTNAEWYEFFLDGVPQGGVQEENFITFDNAIKDHTRVTAKYYYPLSFLKPKMMDVQGSESWHWGTANSDVGTETNAKIPDFKMSETEVTQAQYEYVMGTNPAYFRCGNSSNSNANSYANKGYATSALPVETVSWYDAITYCNKLSLKENKEPCYTVSTVKDWVGSVTIPKNNNSDWDAAKCDFSKDGYRLPTESEWEYAARGGVTEPSDHRIYSGDTDPCKVSWYDNNNNKDTECADPFRNTYGTKPVAKKKANKLGLYDMSGNVREWCWNWYSSSKEFPAATPNGSVQSSCGVGNCSGRVFRSGYWEDDEYDCRVSYRYYNDPNARLINRGFRVACKGD
jgi:formylglycine-generating enzyme required for sulfatase activity